MAETLQSVQYPGIMKYVQQNRTGVQSHQTSRHAIGYILRGRKYIYYGDVRYEVGRGEMFYVNIGMHYMEDIPESGKTFEQIMFFYTPDRLSDILSGLNTEYQIHISNDHDCDNCRDTPYVVYPAWGAARSFFSTINQYIKDDMFNENSAAEKMKLTELVYLIISNPLCCLKSRILNNADTIRESFEKSIQRHIFSDISIEELARICNKSLTSFKKEFKEHFHESPHRWLIRQRLMHSRLLLISTNKSVSEIGNECNFPNTSHYIKLFKKEYGITPAVYRAKSTKRH